jgi:biotin-dependent carboxylase-like uncharacterized protein
MVKVLKTGFYDTIQDLGRTGCQEYGVPVSGVMDSYSAKLANALLNNDENDAVLEITMTGPMLQFNVPTVICVTGAHMSPKLNAISIKTNAAIGVLKGDVLSFGKLNYGFRSYLAVSGGFLTENSMSSRSMYQHITTQIRLHKNDELQILESNTVIKNANSSLKVQESHFTSKTMEVYKGSEFDTLSNTQKEKLFSKEFTISKINNRMAYQLEALLENSLKPIITSLVLPGTVQLTPSGKLIVLMKDCQTTGGYPRVLQLKDASIQELAQKFTGQIIRFKCIN